MGAGGSWGAWWPEASGTREGRAARSMTTLLAPFIPYLLTAFAALLMIFGAFFKGRADGRKLERAKDADAYEKHIQDIERASAAQPRGSVSDDPYNRG